MQGKKQELNWKKFLKLAKEQTSIANYNTWFSKTEAKFTDNNVLIISVPSAFIKDQLLTKQRMNLENLLLTFFGSEILYQINIDSSLDYKKSKKEPEGAVEFDLYKPKANVSQSGLNPKYTLESFVVGLSNNLAYAAAQAVSQTPGISYNPLFIYGGTGVGKTHLMQGIGHSLLKQNPSLKVIYCPLETFMNDLIQSIQTKSTNQFRQKYRSVDLFLVDDIQFISGRDSTQEEFFNTFNALQIRNAQIVLTSDRPPHEIDKLEGRLASRFQGGLMVDIQTPDFDTRVAILRAKCAERKETVPEECLTVLAENMPTNARELEGKLIQIIQTSKSNGQSLTVEYVKQLLGQAATPAQKPDQKKVISVINQYFSTKTADLTGPRRKKELVFPRQIAMYLLYEECKIPFERVGQILGGRDHTTILHGVEKIREAIQRDREVQRIVIEIKQKIL